MTFLQRSLGLNYKWWYIFKFAFKSNTTYRVNSIMWLLSSFVLIISMIFVWYINYTKTGDLQLFRELFTYFVVAEAFVFGSAIQYDIGENIQDGKFTTKLLRPTNVFGFYFLNATGYQFFENISKLVIYSLFAILFNLYFLFSNFYNFSLFLLVCIIGFVINVLIGLIIGLLAFWFTAFFGTANFFNTIKILLSGSFFPLNLLSVTYFATFLPFSYTFFHPSQIYLGKYNNSEVLQTFVGGILWCLILWILARWVFKLGLKKNEAVGL